MNTAIVHSFFIQGAAPKGKLLSVIVQYRCILTFCSWFRNIDTCIPQVKLNQEIFIVY